MNTETTTAPQQPTAIEAMGLAWFDFRDGLPLIGDRILCGNTGARVDGMSAVYLGGRRKDGGRSRGWEHLVRVGGTEMWVGPTRLGEIR